MRTGTRRESPRRGAEPRGSSRQGLGDRTQQRTAAVGARLLPQSREQAPEAPNAFGQDRGRKSEHLGELPELLGALLRPERARPRELRGAPDWASPRGG